MGGDVELSDIERSEFLKSQSSKREKKMVRDTVSITFNSGLFAQESIT